MACSLLPVCHANGVGGVGTELTFMVVAGGIHDDDGIAGLEFAQRVPGLRKGCGGEQGKEGEGANRHLPHYPARTPSGTGLFRNCQDRSGTVRIADIEEHAFGNDAAHFPRFQVDHKQRLAAFDLAGIRALLLESGDDLPLVVAEIDAQDNQLVGTRNVFDGPDRAGTDIDLVQHVDSDCRLDCGRCHGWGCARRTRASSVRTF